MEKYNNAVEEYKKNLILYETAMNSYNKEIDKQKKDYKNKCKAELEEARKQYKDFSDSIDSKLEKEYNPRCYEAETIEMIDTEIDQAERLLREMIHTRSAYYNSGIVFSKYCNVVACSTFYEYLISGRCDALEGANGAYNIYVWMVR